MEIITLKTMASLPKGKKKYMEIQRGPRISTQVMDKNDKDFRYQVILDTNSWVEEFSKIEGFINRHFQDELKGTCSLKDYKILSNDPSTSPWEQYFHTDYAPLL